MRVEQLGTGTPTVAVVGAVHGDEPCGARAIERLLADDPPVEKPVKLIVANEEALDRGVRYLDADLNRAFGTEGTEVEEEAHEHALARRLAKELAGCIVLSIHSTQSYDEPFGIVNELAPPVDRICPLLSISALVEVEEDEGRLFALEAADLIEVEAGLQGTEQAAENAYRIAREFLTATGVLPGKTVGRDLAVYAIRDPIEKPPAKEYEVYAENFERVEAGEEFAAADGETLAADEPFYPVLLSPYGYDDVFGFVGTRKGVLPEPESETPR